MKQQTAVGLLFAEFRALAQTSRKAGDDKTANLIDFLCEREEVTKQVEKEQIMNAYSTGADDEYEYHVNNSVKREDIDCEKYFNENYN